MLGACLRWYVAPAAILVLYAATIAGAVLWEKAASHDLYALQRAEPRSEVVNATGEEGKADGWTAIHLSHLSGGVAGDDGRWLVTILLTPTKWSADFTTLDALYHPGVTVSQESIVVAAATGRVRELGGSLTEAEMDALLEHTGWPVEWRADAKAIAFCESKYSPGAVGDGGDSLGLWQLWTGWARAAGYEVAQLFDPEVNARVALYVRQVRGRFGGGGGWTCPAPSE